jgi:hypothetical protein
VPNQRMSSQSTSSYFSSGISSAIANNTEHKLCNTDLANSQPGTQKAIIWTAEIISETPGKLQMTCFFPPRDKLGGKSFNTFSYLNWSSTSCMHANAQYKTYLCHS